MTLAPTPPLATRPAVAVFDSTYSSTLAFIASLGTRGIPVDVYGSGMLGATRWSRFCSSYTRCPPIDEPDKFLPWLREQIRSGTITRVAPTSDLIAFYLSELRAEFSPEVQRTIATLTEIENCLIKSRFADVCAAHGIATPVTAAPTTLEQAMAFAERVGYPVVLKAKSHLAVGMSERGAIIENAQQLREHFRPYALVAGHEYIARRYPELRLPLLQQFIASAAQAVYSISGLKDAQLGIVSVALSCKREQWPPRVGVSTHQVSCDDQHILQVGMAAVEQLLSCGLFELELLMQPDGSLLAIDLNPRSFGFMNLDIARGSDLPWLWYQSSLDLLQARCVQPLATIECRHSLTFYVSRLIMLLRGPQRGQKLRNFWQELQTPWVSMTGQWRDPVPKVLAMLQILAHPRSLMRPYWQSAPLAAVTPAEFKAQPRSLKRPERHSIFGDAANPANSAMVALEHLATGAHPQMNFSALRDATARKP